MKRLDFSLLSVGELAAKLGVTSATIRRWCRAGKLTETLRTVGNHRRFASCSFSHLIKKRNATASDMPESPATIKNLTFSPKFNALKTVAAMRLSLISAPD